MSEGSEINVDDAASDAGAPIGRAARADDLDGMLDVIETAFSSWPPFEVSVPARDHLEWKLGPDGESGIGHHSVVTLDGRVVATRLRWSAAVQLGETTHHWENSADMAVHPEFQGRGIARILGELMQEGYAASGHVGLGTESRSPQVQHMDGPRRNLRPLTVWTRQRSTRAFAAVHLRSGGLRQLARALVRVARQRRVRGRAEVELRDGRIEELGRFDGRTDALWEQARHGFEVITQREERYQNWRHLDARGGRVLALALIEGEQCLGYVVLKPDGHEVNVVDLLVEPGRPAVAAALLSEGVARLGAAGYRGFTMWLPTGHAYEAGLRGAGFIETTEHGYTFANQLYDDGSPEEQRLLRDPSTRFHITMSDFDYF